MEPFAPVAFADLLDAFEWVSAMAPMENSAYVSRATGKTYLASRVMALDDELPEDIDDGSLYVAVPHKIDLNLGMNLAISFTEDNLPDSYKDVCGIFRQRGAYGRFKDLLERKGCLDAWYAYEAKSTERALREWCVDNAVTTLG